MTHPLAEAFFARGQRFLGCRTPILGGAMTWISEPQLVAAICNADAFACLAGGNSPPELLAAQIRETRELTDKPFGVNLVTIAPAFKPQMQLLAELRPPVIVFAGSFPRRREIELARAAQARVLCFASTLSIARRMIRYGADGLILEGMEAGGHVGHVSLGVLLQQVLFQVQDVPIFVAGGVATGRMCAHLFLMGAAGVQVGTRFAIASESRAHPEFKRFMQNANARDAVATPQFDSRLPVVAVRALRNRGMADFNHLQMHLIRKLENGEIRREQAQEEVEKYWMGALRRAVVDGDVEHGSVMAGQSVGLVDQIQPVADIITDLVTGIGEELERVRGLLST